METRRREFLKAGLGASSLFLPLPYASVWAQSEGAIRLLRVPKVALVIGNGNYKSVPLLRNPLNDANAVAEVLKGFGFDVTLKLDGSRAEMEAAIQAYTLRLAQERGVGLFYYAGHGLQLSWTNFLVPVDAVIRKAEDVQARCIDLSGLMQGVRKAANPLNIIIIDACRENPFERDFRVSSKGLTQMETPNDTLLAYATAPGNVASDGEGANGLYTEALVKELRTPETRVEDVFKRVRLNVRRKSQGAQVPWETTSLEEDFWFLPPPQFVQIAEARVRKESEERVRAQTEAQRAAEAEAERKARVEARVKREREDYESPESRRKSREELARWEGIKNSQNAADFYAFLLERPSGYLSELAQFRLDQLERPVVQAQPGADGIKHLASGVNRFMLGDVLVSDSIDLYTNIATRLRLEVTYADNERAEFNGGIYVTNQMGGILKDVSGTKQPANIVSPADITKGKRWRSAFTNTSPNGVVTEALYDNYVIGLERVTVPAGTFLAYKVEAKGWWRGGPSGGGFQSRVSWIDPVTMHIIRTDIEQMWSRGWAGPRNSYQRVSFERAPR